MKMDLFWHPDPILSLVVSFLPFCSICKLAQTCKRFRGICVQDSVFVKKRKIVKDHINHVNEGMFDAACGGHRDIVDFFIVKGAWDWNGGMFWAAGGGHRDLVDFFIEKGATDWWLGKDWAAMGGNQTLVEFFKQKI